MRLSISLSVVILATFLTVSSCGLVTEVNQYEIIFKRLQEKEWVLKQDIIYGNNINFAPQSFDFISDNEVIFTYEDANGVTKTENHNYTIDFVTDYNVQFNIDIYSAQVIFPVVGLTDNSMTVIFNSSRILDFE